MSEVIQFTGGLDEVIETQGASDLLKVTARYPVAELRLAALASGSCPGFSPSPHQPPPELLRPLLLWALEATRFLQESLLNRVPGLS